MDQLPALGRAKRYILGLINTSFDSTFVFSIDNHNLTIVGTDFVPIHNYTNTSVLVEIGQRYHVIVEAKPIPHGRVNHSLHRVTIIIGLVYREPTVLEKH